MRIIIILLAAIAIYSTAFYRPKCEHVFTKVEQPEIQIEREGWVSSVYIPPSTGKQEGDDLICVKCFHKQKQILDYGNPIVPPNMFRWPSGSLINCCDTLRRTLGSSGLLSIDTISIISDSIAGYGHPWMESPVNDCDPEFEKRIRKYFLK